MNKLIESQKFIAVTTHHKAGWFWDQNPLKTLGDAADLAVNLSPVGLVAGAVTGTGLDGLSGQGTVGKIVRRAIGS